MKINEIISSSDEKLYELCSTLKEQCSEFLDEMKQAKRFLYRGISSDKPYFEANSPPYRNPQGQSIQYQNLLDICLKMNGFGALRSNSICCTSDLKHATAFANSYLIFPKNGYEFTWSPIIEDIGGSDKLYDILTFLYRKNSESVEFKPSQLMIKECRFKNRDMTSALKSENEISIHGKYIAIAYKYKNDVGVFLQ
jgi:hypothetical protein